VNSASTSVLNNAYSNHRRQHDQVCKETGHEPAEAPCKSSIGLTHLITSFVELIEPGMKGKLNIAG
jgi:hypothetical protein